MKILTSIAILTVFALLEAPWLARCGTGSERELIATTNAIRQLTEVSLRRNCQSPEDLSNAAERCLGSIQTSEGLARIAVVAESLAYFDPGGDSIFMAAFWESVGRLSEMHDRGARKAMAFVTQHVQQDGSGKLRLDGLVKFQEEERGGWRQQSKKFLTGYKRKHLVESSPSRQPPDSRGRNGSIQK
jgi:hypothetical protein